MMRRVLLALTLLTAAPAAAQTLVTGAVLPGWTTESGTRMAAIRLDLAPGWKTYWRAPGEAGIPPEFDWSGSENLGAVQIHWPAPERFLTSGLLTLGYDGQAVLPVEVTPREAGRPVTLRARVAMGICQDICVPAEVTVEARLAEGGSADAGMIRAALELRPRTAAEAGVGRVACAVEPIADGLRVTAEIALPGARGDETVVMEPANPGVWVSDATVERADRALVATAEMVPPEGAPFALDRSDLRLTVIDDQGAVDIPGCPAP